MSIASLPGMQERTILVNGFSKAFAMTGWRLGYACGPAPVMKQHHQAPPVRHHVRSHHRPVCGDRGHGQRGGGHANGCAGNTMLRRRYIVDRLNAMGLTCFEPEGAFYVFPSIAVTGMDSETFCERLLREKHVAVVPGTAFGECGEGFVRISYCYSIQHITEAMGRMEEFPGGASGADKDGRMPVAVSVRPRRPRST